MNGGMHPIEVAKAIKLPPSLRDDPWLQSFYGTPEWSSRAIFDAYIGWFSGNPEELFPLTPTKRGTRMVKSFGSEKVKNNNMDFISNYCCSCSILVQIDASLDYGFKCNACLLQYSPLRYCMLIYRFSKKLNAHWMTTCSGLWCYQHMHFSQILSMLKPKNFEPKLSLA